MVPHVLCLAIIANHMYSSFRFLDMCFTIAIVTGPFVGVSKYITDERNLIRNNTKQTPSTRVH